MNCAGSWAEHGSGSRVPLAQASQAWELQIQDLARCRQAEVGLSMVSIKWGLSSGAGGRPCLASSRPPAEQPAACRLPGCRRARVTHTPLLQCPRPLPQWASLSGRGKDCASLPQNFPTYPLLGLRVGEEF